MIGRRYSSVIAMGVLSIAVIVLSGCRHRGSPSNGTEGSRQQQAAKSTAPDAVMRSIIAISSHLN